MMGGGLITHAMASGNRVLGNGLITSALCTNLAKSVQYGNLIITIRIKSFNIVTSEWVDDVSNISGYNSNFYDNNVKCYIVVKNSNGEFVFSNKGQTVSTLKSSVTIPNLPYGEYYFKIIYSQKFPLDEMWHQVILDKSEVQAFCYLSPVNIKAKYNCELAENDAICNWVAGPQTNWILDSESFEASWEGRPKVTMRVYDMEDNPICMFMPMNYNVVGNGFIFGPPLYYSSNSWVTFYGFLPIGLNCSSSKSMHTGSLQCSIYGDMLSFGEAKIDTKYIQSIDYSTGEPVIVDGEDYSALPIRSIILYGYCRYSITQNGNSSSGLRGQWWYCNKGNQGNAIQFANPFTLLKNSVGIFYNSDTEEYDKYDSSNHDSLDWFKYNSCKYRVGFSSSDGIIYRDGVSINSDPRNNSSSTSEYTITGDLVQTDFELYDKEKMEKIRTNSFGGLFMFVKPQGEDLVIQTASVIFDRETEFYYAMLGSNFYSSDYDNY